MSRSFAPSAGTDSISFSPPAHPVDQGPITIAVWAKAADAVAWTGWLLRGFNGASPILGFLTSNNGGPKLFAENDFGAGVAGRVSGQFRWYVMRKAAGGSSVPTISVGDPATNTWAHTPNNAGVSDGTGPMTTLILGNNAAGGSQGWRGSIGIAAMWESVLTDGQVEAALTLAAADAYNATPSVLYRLNQASTATAVIDDMGTGADQSAITGTTVDADDGGMDYDLAPPPPEEHDSTGTAPVSVTATATVTTSRTTSGTATASIVATATTATARVSSGTAPVAATARAVSASTRVTAGTAPVTMTATNYSAGGAPGPRIISRPSSARIVTRAQVAN